ncbi:MAG: hypothetical protein N2204_00060 [Anaerolineae bacterium]|nr:hypothetical protein [Anaerolineae bacterium]
MAPQLARTPGLIAFLAAVLLWLLVSPQLSQVAAADTGPNRAALVVRFSDGRVETRCVSFEPAAISGLELLERSGLRTIVDYNSGLGGAVCSISNEGCAFPREDCFCRCQGATCEYWAYYHGQDGRWLYSEVGASSYQVTDGAVEGWSWGKGNFSSGTEPPFYPFEEVCPASPTTAAAPAGALLAPVAHAQELQPSAAKRAPEGPGADVAGYIAFSLLALALAAAWAWAFKRRRHTAPDRMYN